MLGELENARVKGKNFQEIQVDIMRLVRSYIFKNYCKYPILKSFGISEDDVEMEVYNSLYNRKPGCLSNCERYFIKASDLGEEGALYDDGTKYLVCVIRRVVSTSFALLNRTLLVKGGQPAFHYSGFKSQRSNRKASEFKEEIIDRGFGYEEKYQDLHYEDLLNQIPNTVYSHLKIEIDGKVVSLTNRLLLDLIVRGYGRSDLISRITNLRTGKTISVGNYARIYGNIRKIARESLQKYMEQ